MHDVVFFPTTFPRRDLSLTITYGTANFLHKAGRKRAISIGSTSKAIATKEAFLVSTSLVTSLIPYATVFGRLVTVSAFPLAFSSARLAKRSFLACLLSGAYLSKSLKTLRAKK